MKPISQLTRSKVATRQWRLCYRGRL